MFAKKSAPFIFYPVIIAIFISLCPFHSLNAQNTSSYKQLSPECEISILSCNAGTEIYSLFGHSAIRVCDTTLKIDYVFNYGLFNFQTPNFMWRFVKGETDYQLGIQDYKRFIAEYTMDNRLVYEQILALDQQQKQLFFDALCLNYQPENRIYRYNFLFDNCSSRIKDKLNTCFPKQINFPPLDTKNQTFMEVLSPYFSNHPWTKLGVHIILGAPLHRKLTPDELNFLPDYLFQSMAQADINGSPLVKASQKLTPDSPPSQGTAAQSPIWVACAASLLSLLLLIREQKRRQLFKLPNGILFFCAGFLGLFLTLFMSISEHPAIFPNFDILWLLPTHLIYALWGIYKWPQKTQKYYHLFTLVSGLLFLALCCNYLSTSLVLLALILWIRSLSIVLLSCKKQKTN